MKHSFFPYIGGKFRLADKIIELMPKHDVYIEVFGGSGKVLLNKPPSKIEIYNDYNKQLANLFYVVAMKFDEFIEKINRVIYSREIFYQFREELKNAKIEKLGDVDMAVKTYYLLHISFSGDMQACSFSLSTVNNKAKIFFRGLDKLYAIQERLKNVVIESLDFRDILKKYKDKENAFLYVDPPYYGVSYYNSNFTEKDHIDLLSLLKTAKAKWMLSGYANDLYDEMLKDFHRIELPVVKHAYGVTRNSKGKDKPKAVEVLWANYELQ
jgi:Site-specific DNA methylase